MDPVAAWDERARRSRPVVRRIREVAATDANFLALSTDDNFSGIRVYRVGGATDAAKTAAYEALATAEFPVTVHNALLSRKQYDTLLQAMMSDGNALRAEGVPITGAGMETESESKPLGKLDGRFEIRVHPLTPEAEEKLLSHFGDAFYGRDKIVVVDRRGLAPLSGRTTFGPNHVRPGGTSLDGRRGDQAVSLPKRRPTATSRNQ